MVVGALVLLAFPAAVGTIHTSLAPSLAAKADPTCRVGTRPQIPAYDPVTHDTYVPNEGSSNVTVLSGTCTLVGTIALPGSDPFAAAFDPRTNDIDVTDAALNQVYQISGLTVEATTTGFDDPTMIVYDPACNVAAGHLGCMVVANSGTTTVESLSGVTFHVGREPFGLAYDSFWNTIVVSNILSNNVTVLNARTLTSVANVTVGTEPIGVAFDPSDCEDYVANEGSNNVTVLGGAAGPGGIDGTITGFDNPRGVAWDQSNLRIYVTNNGDGKVFELSVLAIVKKASTAAGSEATGLSFDAASDKMYVAGFGTNLVYVLS